MDTIMPPVTVDKIIEKSNQWTLEGDCTLLQWMNQISKNLEERVNKTSFALNDMSTKLDRTSIALSNATNNLAALQYSKFVENRVQDDDETLANPSDVQERNVTDEQNSTQDVYSFLKKNLEMMNSCHEAYSISYDDSDDDDDDEPVTNVVYRSKNPYEARPLPHIYGSNLWKEKWHIGLCDSDNDFSGDENSEQFSESSSTADDSYESTAPTMSEWDSTAWGLNTNQSLERKGFHSPSNDGESQSQIEDFPQSKVSTPRTQRHLPLPQEPIQDQRYYQHVPRRQESLFDDIFNESKPQEVPTQVISPPVVAPQVLKKVIPESYIPNEPPPDEHSNETDGNRRVNAKKTLNLFDDDEFSSFMDQIVQKANNKNMKPNEHQVNHEPPTKVVTQNRFDDSNVQVPSLVTSQQQETKTLAPNLFSDSDDLFSRPSEKSDSKVQATSSVASQQQQNKTLAPNLFSDSDDLFSRPLEKSDSNVQAASSVASQQQQTKTLSPNLFSDSDDLFSRPLEKSDSNVQAGSSVASQQQQTTILAPNLFSDSDDLFSRPSEKSQEPAKRLFNDSEDLFTSAREPTIVKRKVPSPEPEADFFIAPPQPEVIGKTKIKNLFDDDEDDDDFDRIFASKPSQSSKTNETAKNLFKDDYAVEPENQGLFLEKKSGSSKNHLTTNQELFNDEDKSSMSIEQEISTKSNVIEKNLTEKVSLLKKNLFDDEDDDMQDEDDIFSSKSAKKDAFEEIFSKDDSNKMLPAFKSNLFEDEEEKAEDSKKTENRNGISVKELPSAESTDAKNVSNLYAKDLTDEKEGTPNEKTQFEKPVIDDSIETGNVPPTELDPAEKPISSPKLPTISQKPKTLPVISKKPLVDNISKPKTKIPDVVSVKADSLQISQEIEVESGQGDTKIQNEKNPSSLLVPSEVKTPDLKTASETSETLVESFGSSTALKTDDKLKIVNAADNDQDTPIAVQTQKVHKNEKIEQNKSENLVPKPILKTKPKTMPEDKKLSSDNKKLPQEDLNVQQSAKKLSTIPSYKSLFHDDLPPEDESPNPTINEESPVHTIEDDVQVNPTSSSKPYSSINLFAEVPPDDDFSAVDTPLSETKRIHSIFYDDFHETIEAGREMRAPPSYIINDEPPPDEVDNKPVISEVKSEKPKVSKLKKMNIQINVGALLPTAKMPSFKKPEPIEKFPSKVGIIKEDHISEVKAPIVPLESHVSSERQTPELPGNMLPNLNRNRAKVQIKRKPSTRKGRQESYRKSMIEETIQTSDQDLDEDETATGTKKSMSNSLFGTLEKGITETDGKRTSAESRHQERKNETTNKTTSSALLKDLETFHAEKANKDSSETINQLPDRATLFEESDKFITKNMTSSSIAKATTSKIPSLFKNPDSEPENIFETMKANNSNANKSESNILPSTTKNLDSLFDSDGFDENPFGTPKNFNPQSNKMAEVKSTPQRSASAMPIESKGQTLKEEQEKPTLKSSSLFADESDDGSDDLFKEAKAATPKTIVTGSKPKVNPMSKQTKPSASLFSSDEENGSGDDLFGKGNTKVSAKKIKPVKVKTTSSLFADLSDDDSDDLFGTSKKNPTGVNKTKPNPSSSRTQPKKPSTQVQQAKANNNPLSDLLGP